MSDRQSRITPAYAGKSFLNPKHNDSYQDHPRLCGEKKNLPTPPIIVSGSPPPMRGKVCGVLLDRGVSGITPAYAGKSYHPPSQSLKKQDHPRLCGEKCQIIS